MSVGLFDGTGHIQAKPICLWVHVEEGLAPGNATTRIEAVHPVLKEFPQSIGTVDAEKSMKARFIFLPLSGGLAERTVGFGLPKLFIELDGFIGIGLSRFGVEILRNKARNAVNYRIHPTRRSNQLTRVDLCLRGGTSMNL